MPFAFSLLHFSTHPAICFSLFCIPLQCGAARDTVDFQAKRVAPRTYIVTVPGPLVPGKYGFLPPGTMNTGKNLASSGEMYTFTLVE
jgi:hypothetical protein